MDRNEPACVADFGKSFLLLMHFGAQI